MKGSKVRPAEVRDAENLRRVYQAAIRGLGSGHYPAEQIDRWANRPIEAFEQDIQDTSVLVTELHSQIIGFAAIDAKRAEIRALYVHPDYARQGVGSFLLMCLQAEAHGADSPRSTVNATLNAVEFFRAHKFVELGPGTIPLADGTSLPGVKMQHQPYRKIEFASDQSLADRVLTCLRCEDHSSRIYNLRALKQQAPGEVLEVIVSLLNHAEERTRRRAAGALNLFSKEEGEAVNVEQKAEELAHYLEHGEDPIVRMSCALRLVPVRSPTVDRAFLRALADPCADVVVLSCHEAGDRCGAEGTAALMGLLDHSSWQVRLHACITLIQQKTADPRVVAALENLSQAPEAAEHDAFDEEFREFNREFGLVCGAAEAELAEWSTVASILEKARAVANQAGSQGKAG